MTKIPESERDLRLLVNCKTYPAISQKYIETVCTGGVQDTGEFVRLYPVPFRFLDESERYDRWDIIQVRAYKDTKDRRPESWHWIPGTPIKVLQQLTSESQRWQWMKPTVHESRAAMDINGVTNGCVRIVPLELYHRPEDAELTEKQLKVVRQTNLFISDDDLGQIAERLPWQFRLRYVEASTGLEDDAKVLAWSWYQGLRRNLQRMNEAEALEATMSRIRKSMFDPNRTVFAIFGTHSRFGHWMISAIYHVPTSIVSKGHLF